MYRGIKTANYYNKIIKTCKWLFNEYRSINKLKSGNSNIILGRTFALGGRVGYQLAKDLFSDSKYTVIVDPAITIKDRRNPLYPDMIVTKDNKLKAVIELKIDLGLLKLENYGIGEYSHKKQGKRKKREYSYKKQRNDFMEKYSILSKSRQACYNIKDECGKVKDRRELAIPQNFKKIAIIFTKNNDHGRALRFQEAMKDAKFQTLFLLEKNHPNNPKCTMGDIKEELKLKTNQIEKMFSGI